MSEYLNRCIKEHVGELLMDDNYLPVAPLINIVLQYAVVPVVKCRTLCDFPAHYIIRIPKEKTASILSLLCDIDLKTSETRHICKSDKDCCLSVSSCETVDYVVYMVHYFGHEHRWGVGSSGNFTSYQNFDTGLTFATSLVVDPHAPLPRLYRGGATSVRRFDWNPTIGEWTVFPIAGAESMGFCDGKAEVARFSQVVSIVISHDGKQLVVADSENRRTRTIDVSDESSVDFGTVRTVMHMHEFIPQSLVYATSSPDSALVVSCKSGRICKLDLSSIPSAFAQLSFTETPEYIDRLIVRVRLSDNIFLGSMWHSIVSFSIRPNDTVHIQTIAGHPSSCSRDEISKDIRDGISKNGEALSEARFAFPDQMCLVENGAGVLSLLITDSRSEIRELDLLPAHMYR